MKNYKLTMRGPFISEIVVSLPEWTQDDEGREIYVSDEQKRYFADSTSWVIYSEFLPGTTTLFGNNSAPVGWTRKTEWQDSAMFCYRSSSIPTSGGGINPQSTHTHTGPGHTHTMQNHTHSMQSHTHNGPSHTHTMSHTHDGPSHTHTMSHTHNHNHSLPSGSGIGGGTDNVAINVTNTDVTGSSAANTGSGGTGNTGAASVASTGSGGTGDTGTPSDASTDVPSNNTTVAGGTGATGSNTAPYFQELIAAVKD